MHAQHIKHFILIYFFILIIFGIIFLYAFSLRFFYDLFFWLFSIMNMSFFERTANLIISHYVQFVGKFGYFIVDLNCPIKLLTIQITKKCPTYPNKLYEIILFEVCLIYCRLVKDDLCSVWFFLANLLIFWIFKISNFDLNYFIVQFRAKLVQHKQSWSDKKPQ